MVGRLQILIRAVQPYHSNMGPRDSCVRGKMSINNLVTEMLVRKVPIFISIHKIICSKRIVLLA